MTSPKKKTTAQESGLGNRKKRSTTKPESSDKVVALGGATNPRVDPLPASPMPTDSKAPTHPQNSSSNLIASGGGGMRAATKEHLLVNSAPDPAKFKERTYRFKLDQLAGIKNIKHYLDQQEDIYPLMSQDQIVRVIFQHFIDLPLEETGKIMRNLRRRASHPRAVGEQ